MNAVKDVIHAVAMLIVVTWKKDTRVNVVMDMSIVLQTLLVNRDVSVLLQKSVHQIMIARQLPFVNHSEE